MKDKYEHLKEIDFSFINAHPKIILGLDKLHITCSEITYEKNGLVACKTKLGNVIYGKLNTVDVTKTAQFKSKSKEQPVNLIAFIQMSENKQRIKDNQNH